MHLYQDENGRNRGKLDGFVNDAMGMSERARRLHQEKCLADGWELRARMISASNGVVVGWGEGRTALKDPALIGLVDRSSIDPDFRQS